MFGAALALGLGPLLAGGPAGATVTQTETEQTEPGRAEAAASITLALVDQTPFVVDDGTFTVTIDLSDLPDLDPAAEVAGDAADTTDENEDPYGGPQLAITVYGRITESAQLDQDPVEPINRLPLRPLAEIPVTGEVATVRMPVRSGPAFDDVDRVLLPESGVYPVTIEVRVDDTTIGAVRTNLIRLPAVTEPGSESDGEADGGVGDALLPPVSVVLGLDGSDGPSLAEAAELLGRFPAMPITVVLGTEARAELNRDRVLADELRRALDDRGVIATPGLSLDPSSLAAIDNADLYTSSLADTRAAVTNLGLVNDETTVVLERPQTETGAALLAESGVERVIDRGALDSGEGAAGRVGDGPDAPTMVAPDPLTTDLPAEAGPADRVQRVLARLAMAGPDRPVLLDADTGAEQRRVTLALLFDALTDDAVEVLPLSATAPLLAGDNAVTAARPAQDLTPVAETLADARAALATYEGFHFDGPYHPDQYRSAITAALALDVDEGERSASLRRTADELRTRLDVISLPENQSVTLAATSVPIPLTIENEATGARQVLLQFRSDKILVAEHGHVITVGPGTSSIDIQVEARSLGLSPLEVFVLTPDGQRVLSTTRFQVRSTAVPGLGLLISAVGLILLAGWWWISIRRKRKADPTDSGAPPTGGPPDASDERVDADEADVGARADRGRALAGGSV